MKLLVSTKVRCENHLHTISVTRAGRLRFHDHDKTLWIEEDLRVMGGLKPACRCGEVLRAWRQKNNNRVPKKLWSIQPLFFRAPYKPYKQADLRDRMKTYTEKVATVALAGCDYRCSSQSEEPHTCIEADPGYVSSIMWSDNGKWAGAISIQLNTSWLKLHRRGIEVVTNRKNRQIFVLEEIPGSVRGMKPGQFIAIAGKQRAGFSVTSSYALIDERDRRLVRWLKHESISFATTRRLWR